MHRKLRLHILSAAGSLSITAILCLNIEVLGAPDSPKFAVLVYTKTAGFRHDSIAAGIDALRLLGNQHAFNVEDTENSAIFNDDDLARYRVVVFLNTTGDVLNSREQASFENFVRRGGGFVGIHSASDTEYDWPWYGQLIGAYFDNHPVIQTAIVDVANSAHPSTEKLRREWPRNDEWYNFREHPSSNVNVLLNVDEKTYAGGTMGERHPISWYHEVDGGRAWYTAMGHTIESYSEPAFLDHLLGGILWAASDLRSGYAVVTADSSSTPPEVSVTFSFNNGTLQSQSTTNPQSTTTDASMPVDIAPGVGRNLGVAIASLATTTSTVTMTLRESSNGRVSEKFLLMPLQPGQQTAKFLSEFYRNSIGTESSGNLRIQSNSPVSVIALRFSGMEFSAVAISNAAPANGVIVIPQIVTGAGWNTQITLANHSTDAIYGRVAFFDPAGNAMPIRLNGVYQSTFKYSIPPGTASVFSGK